MKTAVCGIGGLGHVALQFLNKLGYDVTAFTSSANKVDMIKKLGATHVVISSDPKEMEKVKDSFDFIINTILLIKYSKLILIAYKEVVSFAKLVNLISMKVLWESLALV